MIGSPKANEVPSVSNKLAEHHGEVDNSILHSPTETIQMPTDEEPSSVINEMYEEQPIPTGYALVDTKDVRKSVMIVSQLQPYAIHTYVRTYA